MQRKDIVPSFEQPALGACPTRRPPGAERPEEIRDAEPIHRARAQQSHQLAVDGASDVRTVADPNKDQDADQLVRNMVNYILHGISPVDEAPEVPAESWEKVKRSAERRITLASDRIADLVLSAAADLEAGREFVGR